MMRRNHEHVFQFMMAELGTEGSIDGNQRLVIRGKFVPKVNIIYLFLIIMCILNIFIRFECIILYINVFTLFNITIVNLTYFFIFYYIILIRYCAL